MSIASTSQTRLGVRLAKTAGFDPKRFLNMLRTLPLFLKDLTSYTRRNRSSAFHVAFRHLYPILDEAGDTAGYAGQYFYQDLWAARRIFERRPQQHLDVGSRLDGFIAHLLVFMPVTLVDIRPLPVSVPGLTFLQDDATDLNSVSDDSAESLSSLHAAEHFGLGRYGDAIDPSACFRFMAALQRVLAPGGRLYFSVPVGTERLEFNAHRVFDVRTILRQFSRLTLVSISVIDDDGRVYQDVIPEDISAGGSACGLFEFTKDV